MKNRTKTGGGASIIRYILVMAVGMFALAGFAWPAHADQTSQFIGGFGGDHPSRPGITAYYYRYDSHYYYPTIYVPNYVAPPLPPPTYVDGNSGNYCRQFSRQTRIGNQVQESYGTACLQPDGSWRIVDRQ